jgi:hypothetical protein
LPSPELSLSIKVCCAFERLFERLLPGSALA